MLERLGIGEFLGLLIDHVEERTGVRCYDYPDNVPSPLYSVELDGARPDNTKTMFIDAISVKIHCVSEETEPYSNAPVLEMVKRLQEAMTEDVVLPAPFLLYGQEFEGVNAIKRDESGEGHAVLSYRFRVCYGYRCK